MKKFLVLTLVLGMASLANATLTMTVDGVEGVQEITLAPSDTVWIGVTSDVVGETGVTTGQYDALFVITDATLGAWTDFQLGAGTIPDAFGVIDPDGTQVPDLGLLVNSDGVPTTLAPGGLGGEFLFHCIGLGDVVVLMIDLQDGTETPLMIHQIPEPMTLALLGLGGLFLRRRK